MAEPQQSEAADVAIRQYGASSRQDADPIENLQLETQIADQKRVLSSLKTEIVTKDQRLAMLEQNSRQDCRDYFVKLSTLGNEISDLNVRLEEVSDSKDSLEGQIAEQKLQVQNQADAYEGQIAALKSELQHKTSERDLLRILLDLARKAETARDKNRGYILQHQTASPDFLFDNAFQDASRRYAALTSQAEPAATLSSLIRWRQ
ncbi:hypothetical protein QBC35DRAFT_180052 [Podospora australis]|uniref:Uncharacterized protein n=1 Tax=Podospora australis TaxID=1536484 RepID=A0AAN6WZP2_9PEZI|nr:hypothetical protein QBC35DRAFT_180052 [Podospora australis]